MFFRWITLDPISNCVPLFGGLAGLAKIGGPFVSLEYAESLVKTTFLWLSYGNDGRDLRSQHFQCRRALSSTPWGSQKNGPALPDRSEFQNAHR